MTTFQEQHIKELLESKRKLLDGNEPTLLMEDNAKVASHRRVRFTHPTNTVTRVNTRNGQFTANTGRHTVGSSSRTNRVARANSNNDQSIATPSRQPVSRWNSMGTDYSQQVTVERDLANLTVAPTVRRNSQQLTTNVDGSPIQSSPRRHQALRHNNQGNTDAVGSPTRTRRVNANSSVLIMPVRFRSPRGNGNNAHVQYINSERVRRQQASGLPQTPRL